MIMSQICVILLSGAIYAWFTIANNATVNNIKLQVVSDGKLYISSKDDFMLMRSLQTDQNVIMIMT